MRLKLAEEEAKRLLDVWLENRKPSLWKPGRPYILHETDFEVIQELSVIFAVRDYTNELILDVLGRAHLKDSTSARTLIEPGVGWLAKSIPLGSIDEGLAEAILAIFKDNSSLKAKIPLKQSNSIRMQGE